MALGTILGVASAAAGLFGLFLALVMLEKCCCAQESTT